MKPWINPVNFPLSVQENRCNRPEQQPMSQQHEEGRRKTNHLHDLIRQDLLGRLVV